MSPRPGGEAAKFGERFEGRWTVRYLLDVLFGRAESVVVEAVDEDAESVEFYATVKGIEQGHQVKRQWRANASWPISLLRSEGLLADAASHVHAGREYHFVSTLPSRDLDAFSDIARRSDSLEAFERHLDALSVTRRRVFDGLAGDWSGPLSAYEILRCVYVWSPDERLLQRDNSTMAQWLIEGPPDAAVAVLAQIALDTLSATLTGDVLWRELESRGLRRNPLFDDTTLPKLISEQTDRWLRSSTRDLLQPPIPREEAGQVVELIRSGPGSVMVIGTAGIGKTAVVAAAVDEVRNDGWPVLAFRLDRAGDAQSARQLGERLDLPAVSPAIALGSVAAGGPAVLVCDQLDATSRASGRATEAFDVLDELLLQVERFPAMRVLLACRQFDIDNDSRLRSLVDPRLNEPAKVVSVPALDASAVAAAVGDMGLDPATLSESQIELLRSPFNLVLLREAARDADALGFRTIGDLLDSYWGTKRSTVTERRLPQETRFDAVVERLVTAMSDSQRLSVPESVLYADGLSEDASVLASEQVIVREDGRYAFFHEALFDDAFVRTWLRSNRSVVEFLLSGEQELFRRAQVRQVLSYWRENDRERFAAEISTLLTHDDVRFHVKEVVLALLRALDDPTSEELRILVEILESDFVWRGRAELLMRTDPWFERLDADGLLAEWLTSGDDAKEARAVQTMAIGGQANGDRVAELLLPHERHENFPGWLLLCARFIDLDSSRRLFELVLEAVRSGKLDDRMSEVWLSSHALGREEPLWAIELLSAWLVERPAALTVANDRVSDLEVGDHSLLELIRESAEQAPAAFAEALLPYMQQVMALTTVGENAPYRDWHFGVPIWSEHISRAGDALYAAMRAALCAIAADNPARLRLIAEPLAADEHHAAQSLLYQALTAAGPAQADWSADLLLRGGAALEAGFSDGHYWTTRELLAAISPHVSDERLTQLEDLIRSYVPQWEQGSDFEGYAAFTLLSAVDEARLSAEGRAVLAALREKFDRTEPEAPRGIISGIVGSPIAVDEARAYSDEDWRKAMKAYPDESRSHDDFLKGGAHELASHVLQPFTKEDPDRFAQLGLSLDGSYNPAYLDAIIIALGDSEGDFDAEHVYRLVRHAAALGQHDRWLGYALKRLYQAEIPDDILGLLIERAVAAPSDYEGDGDPTFAGLNNTRGTNIHTLAILVSADRSGHRAELVEPHLEAIVDTDSTAVRVMGAELAQAVFPWLPEAGIAAFRALASTDDPELFRAPQFESLAAAVIVREVEAAMPLIESMLYHEEAEVREHGARLATFAASDGGRDDLLPVVAGSEDPAVRTGAAAVLADRARWVTEPSVHEQLVRLFEDDELAVREAAAKVAGNLRGADLAQYEELLRAFIASPALESDITQMAITLEQSAAEIVELSLSLARRFLELFESDIGDIQTHASADARQIGELVLRAYAQVSSSAERNEVLDLIDRLLELNTYGFEQMVEEVGRHG